MKNLKTQLAVLVLFLLCLFTGAYGQSIPSGHGATLGKASPVQSQPATSEPIVQEQEATKPPTYTVLYTSTGGADGAVPYGGSLIRNGAGNLYGTTNSGGNDSGCSSFGIPGCGVVFTLDGAGSETVLYTFTGGTDGGIPLAGLIRGREGQPLRHHIERRRWHSSCRNSLQTGPRSSQRSRSYGAPSSGQCCPTSAGGSSGQGAVFKIDPAGNETVFYSFTGGTDGGYPEAGLIRDGKGNLCGTTFFGGALPNPPALLSAALSSRWTRPAWKPCSTALRGVRTG